jgi:hypothetical protein
MLFHRGFTINEVAYITGLTLTEIEQAIRSTTRHDPFVDSMLCLLNSWVQSDAQKQVIIERLRAFILPLKTMKQRVLDLSDKRY